MKYSADPSKPEPLYMQLYRAVRRDIVSGVLAPGSKLPSKRDLAEEAGVSVITAEHTYSLLADEGYITAKERSGFFVTSGDGVILSHGAPLPDIPHRTPHRIDTEFPLSTFKKHIRSVISSYDDELIERSPNGGCDELREAICGYLDRFRGIGVRRDQIMIGAGAEYLYSLLIQLFGRDARFAVEDPCYKKIEQVYRANGILPERLALGEDGIETASLNGSSASVLHVTPYHSFPSGVTATPAKRAEYISWAKRQDGFIIEDDYESEFSTLSKPLDTIWSLDPDGKVVYLNTFSKTLAPSIRIGYMVIPEGLLGEYRDRLGFYSCTVPVLDQLVLASFINSGEFERHINKMRRRLRRQRREG